MGPGLAFDPSRYFIFCANVLGSPYGSSSPVSKHPDRSSRWGPEFPATTVRDDVRLQKLILDQLGVKSVAAVIGGSMGGMAVLEWPLCTPPGFVRNIIPIATSARHSAWGISWGEAQRQSIYSDPKYNDGYYAQDDPPLTGLAAARMAALLTYRTRDSFQSRFGRNEHAEQNDAWTMPRTPAERALAAHNNGLRRAAGSDRPASPALATTSDIDATLLFPASKQPLIFSAQSYLRYQGNKFVSRFDANCYISITRKMDMHDLSRGDERPPWPKVLGLLPKKTFVVAISSDGLFTTSEMQELVNLVPEASLLIIESPEGTAFLAASRAPADTFEGHDGFLIEVNQINSHILDHLQQSLPELYKAPPQATSMPAYDLRVKKASLFGEAEIEDTLSW